MNNGYSICFNEWALDSEIKDELGLLLIISSLCAEKGHCWATNEYFATLFNVSEVTISRKIKKLENKKYITIEYEKRGCEVKKRTIRLTKLIIDGYQSCYSTINKVDKENNINNKNTNINNNIYSREIEKNIIDYLNKKLDSNYKYDSKKITELIKARLNQGFKEEDFYKVIDKKYNEWNDSEMAIYLRPTTLFGTKFEDYLNQKEVKKKFDIRKVDWDKF